jgi:hypothetical protein
VLDDLAKLIENREQSQKIWRDIHVCSPTDREAISLEKKALELVT